MKERFVELLACPDCGKDLTPAAERGAGEEILEGKLRCAGCGRAWPIAQGVPRFVEPDLNAEARETRRAFGDAWTRFDRLHHEYGRQFLEWIAPVTSSDVAGKTLVDAGCGKGRHLDCAVNWGAKVAVGVELSRAADVAYRNTVRHPNVLVVQADLHRLPLKPVFDYGWSVGVLHHISDATESLSQVVRLLRPGGRFSVWLYGAENNDWIVRFVNPIRRRFTSRMRFDVLEQASLALAGVLYAATHGVYRPARERGWHALERRLWYSSYLTHLGQYDFQEILNIVVDHLVAPVASYYSREEARKIVEGAGLRILETTWVHENSWAVYGERPGLPG